MAPLPGNNHRVLIIDDNYSIHEDFKKILNRPRVDSAFLAADQELFGTTVATKAPVSFAIDSAFQGQEGLEKVRIASAAGTPFAVAFVDVRMPPGWDGIETTEKLWEIEPDLQVVLCTAYSDYSWDEMTTKLDCSDRLVILKKPFDNVEALQLANALSAKWNLLRASRTRVSDLEELVRLRTEDLHRNHERLTIVSQAGNDAIWDWDLATNEFWWNEGFQLHFGHVRTGQGHGFAHWKGLVHPEDVDRVLAGIKAIAETTGTFWTDEYRFRCQDGRFVPVSSRGRVMRDGSGKAIRMVGAMQDISARKKAEHEHHMLELQLRQAQKLESIGQLAAGVAHEINTPMQFIGDNTRFVRDAFGDLQKVLAAGDRLLESARLGAVGADVIKAADESRAAADLAYLTEEVPRALDQAIEGVDRVTKIVRAMKEFSHPDSESKVMVDLNKSIESTLIVCRNEWKYIAELTTDLDPQLPMVPALPGEFNQVVLNLVINAAHAIGDKIGKNGPTRGSIQVQTRVVAGAVEIRIRDSGGGIPEKIRDRIFDPFFTTKPVGKGTGQGLAIARSVIVGKHGGNLDFETAEGVGTCFIITLPLTESPVGEKASAS